jgi:hypothetical protein
MFTKYSKIPIKLAILLVGFGLLVAGCDSTGPSADETTDEGDALIQITDDLGERMTTFGDGESNAIAPSGAKASPKFTLRTRAQIEPPTDARSASHIFKNNDLIYVGYKVPGPTFGGGVDILDASNPTNLGLGDQSLRTPDLDVQEVAVKDNGSDPDDVYMAGAVDFGNIPARDFGNTPATFIRANVDASGGNVTFPGASGSGNNNVSATEVAMPNRLVKALALSPGGTGNTEVYAITDSSAVYGFDSNLSSREVASVGSSAEELRSITTYQDRNSNPRLHALGTTGQLFRFALNGGLGFGSQVNQTNLGNPSDFGISRLQTARVAGMPGLNTDGDDYLHFAGINEGNGNGGIRVLSQNGTEIRYGTNFQAYVTVSATRDSKDNLRVFAGSPGGTIDVFQGADGLQWSAENPGSLSSSEALQAGLELQGSFDLSGLSGDVSVGEGQINQILFHEDTSTNPNTEYLFVATSTEGVVVLEIDSDASDIF